MSVVEVEMQAQPIHYRVVPGDDAVIHIEWVGTDMNPSELKPFNEFLYLPGTRVGNTFRIAFNLWSLRQWRVEDTEEHALKNPYAKIVDISKPRVRDPDPLCAVYEQPGVIWERICATTGLETRCKRAADLMASIPDDDKVAFCEVLLQENHPAMCDPLELYQRTLQVVKSATSTDEVRLLNEIEQLHVIGELCQFAADELLRLCKKQRF